MGAARYRWVQMESTGELHHSIEGNLSGTVKIILFLILSPDSY
jgi:hypothetical protein